MGLILYALLLLFGYRGMAFKRAAAFCLITAAILTMLGLGAIADMPGCSRLSCPQARLTIAQTFFATAVIAFGCFGLGAAARRIRPKSSV